MNTMQQQATHRHRHAIWSFREGSCSCLGWAGWACLALASATHQHTHTQRSAYCPHTHTTQLLLPTRSISPSLGTQISSSAKANVCSTFCKQTGAQPLLSLSEEALCCRLQAPVGRHMPTELLCAQPLPDQPDETLSFMRLLII